MELTEREYVQQQIALGRRIHEHDGVFWEEVYPSYCKPAFVHKAFDPGEARPGRIRSLLGYSHQVKSPGMANREVRLMVLDGERLRGFSMAVLSPKKRNQVRRGLRNCEIRLIEELGPVFDRIHAINVSQAIRQEKGAGAETPHRRYVEEEEEWRAQIRREFALAKREWWGVFVEGLLVAYMRTYQVDGTRIIEQTKADSDYLTYYPVDALYFSVLSAASDDSSCRRIINGRPMHASLNQFKEQFLFEDRAYPYYSSNARLVELGKRLLRLRR